MVSQYLVTYIESHFAEPLLLPVTDRMLLLTLPPTDFTVYPHAFHFALLK